MEKWLDKQILHAKAVKKQKERKAFWMGKLCAFREVKKRLQEEKRGKV